MKSTFNTFNLDTEQTEQINEIIDYFEKMMMFFELGREELHKSYLAGQIDCLSNIGIINSDQRDCLYLLYAD